MVHLESTRNETALALLDKSSIKQGRSSSSIAKTQRMMGDPMSWGLAEAWETNATEWITWASKPDHDAFWTATWPELRAMLGRAGLAITEMREYGNRPVPWLLVGRAIRSTVELIR